MKDRFIISAKDLVLLDDLEILIFNEIVNCKNKKEICTKFEIRKCELEMHVENISKKLNLVSASMHRIFKLWRRSISMQKNNYYGRKMRLKML